MKRKLQLNAKMNLDYFRFVNSKMRARDHLRVSNTFEKMEDICETMNERLQMVFIREETFTELSTNQHPLNMGTRIKKTPLNHRLVSLTSLIVTHVNHKEYRFGS